MKSRLCIILTALIGFSTGGLAVRQYFSNGSVGMVYASPQAPQKSRTGEGRSVAADPKTGDSPSEVRHDFASLVRNSSHVLAGFSPVDRELERMDVAGLKSLLLELVATMKADLQREDWIAASNLRYAAASEIYRREGVAALEWVDGIPKEGKATILDPILARVTKDLPEIGKQWIDKYRGEYGDEWAKGFAQTAVSGAYGRGAEDTLKVLTLFKDDLRGFPRNQSTYAEDFDFHLLVTRQPAGYDFSDAVIYWAARDKEAAWSAVDELIKAGETRGATYFGSMFKGIVTLEGDEKAAAWMTEKLDLIPTDSRERAITALTRYPLPGETAAKLVRAMRTEEDRVLFTAEFATPFRAGSAVEALRALGSEDLQMRALMRSAGRYAGYAANGNPPDQETRDFFTTTMEQLGFTPTSREKIEAALPPAGEAGE